VASDFGSGGPLEMAEVWYTQVKLNRPRQRVECYGKERACASETKTGKWRGRKVDKNNKPTEIRERLFNNGGGIGQKGRVRKISTIFIFFLSHLGTPPKKGPRLIRNGSWRARIIFFSFFH
jgi:hypothetical protein